MPRDPTTFVRFFCGFVAQVLVAYTKFTTNPEQKWNRWSLRHSSLSCIFTERDF